MNTTHKIIALLTVVGWSAVSANAVPPKENAPPAKTPPAKKEQHHAKQAPAPDNGDAALLREAYFTLYRADHDYDGHRIHAMEETARAARLLGTELRGDGGAGERQGVSDEQLRRARGILIQARASLVAHHRPKAVEFVNGAIHQINIALKIA